VTTTLSFLTDLHFLFLAVMIPDDLLTKKDLEEFKKELFTLLSNLNLPQVQDQHKWLKNTDVKKMLNISASTLQNLRFTGELPFSKIGGAYYYKQSDIERMFNKAQKKI
jgi:hypothetical protein